ncbi:MAG: hypothetical protein PHI11_07970 [Gallionella sp.]|nr:hypothetical protein [Gallionella sp.]
MPDKKKERWYLEQLKASWGDFPSGEVQETERPDFLIKNHLRTHGFEITEFVKSPSTGESHHQKSNALRQQIVERALLNHREQRGKRLLIDVEFDDDVRLRNADVKPLAIQLASAVAARDFPEKDLPGWSEIVDVSGLKGILAVCGDYWRGNEDWNVSGGGWVKECTISDLQDVITKKAIRYSAYRTKCETVALVIAFEVSNNPSIEFPKQALEHRYDSPFDQTLLLFANTPQTVVLRNDV